MASMADPVSSFLSSSASSINLDFNTNDKLQMSSSSLNEWFNSDFSSFLNQENVMEPIMDFPQEASPAASPATTLFYTPSPEVFSTSDSSAYSSDSSETHSPFDQFSIDAIQSGINSPIDETLFEPYNLNDPLLVPEIERILAGNPYEIELTSPPLTPPQAELQSTTSNKKRSREDADKAPVTLSRDQLLTMTSKEIEDYAEGLKSKRTLTSTEEKELKRQRRLVKNREYASQSRSRKKLFVDDLEKQLEAARAETEQYKQQNQVLLEENKILKRQLGSIANTIKKVQQNGANNTSANTNNTNNNLSSSAGNVGVFDKLFKVGSGRSSTPSSSSSPPKSVSACLLAIFFMVFTFTAFWDNEAIAKDRIYRPGGDRALFSDDMQRDLSIWEEASLILSENWESSILSSYLPSWESAYTRFMEKNDDLFSSVSFSSPSSPSPSNDKNNKNIINNKENEVIKEREENKTETTIDNNSLSPLSSPSHSPSSHSPPSVPLTEKVCNHNEL